MRTTPSRTRTAAGSPLRTGRNRTAYIHSALLVLAPAEAAMAVLFLAGIPVAPWIPITVGALLLVTVIAEIVLAVCVYGQARQEGDSRRSAVRAIAREAVPAPIVRSARFEALLWESIWRWVSRRPLVPECGQGFSYHRYELPVLLAFAVLGIVEIALVHWLLPWPTVRVVALVLGVMGVVWVLGFLASLSTRPHHVTDTTLTVRVDAHHEIRIERSTITTARTGLKHYPTDGVHLERPSEGGGAGVSVARHGQTNVCLSLADGTTVDVTGHGFLAVNRVAFWVDEPDRLRGHLHEEQSPSRGPTGPQPAS